MFTHINVTINFILYLFFFLLRSNLSLSLHNSVLFNLPEIKPDDTTDERMFSCTDVLQPTRGSYTTLFN